MVAGLVGLTIMAIPAFGRHGHGHAAHAHSHGWGQARGGALRLLKGGRVHAPRALPRHAPAAAGAREHGEILVDAAPGQRFNWLPSPRAIFSLLALYGAFGNALVRAFHLSPTFAALGALLLALLVERLCVKPLFSLLFRFQAPPSSPLEALIHTEARAVVPFRNGRGMVSVELDGRLIQLVARLRDDQAGLPVAVGDTVRVEDIDATLETVTVAFIFDPRSP